MQRTLKYRLYPNRQQRETLSTQLDLCRELYNAGLQERIESYKTTGKGVTWLQQQSQLPAIKEVRPEFNSVHTYTLHLPSVAQDYHPPTDKKGPPQAPMVVPVVALGKQDRNSFWDFYLTKTSPHAPLLRCLPSVPA
jgi:transposase